MNFMDSQAKNYIFTSSENVDQIEEFVKIAATFIKDKKIVLVFTRKHIDFMSVSAGLSKEQMRNLIFSYHSDINSIIEKLLELHDWTIMPDLVILNLNSYFDVANAGPQFKTVCFCISALLSYMKCVELQKGIAQCSANSVSLLNAHPGMQIQLLIDFYFYKMAAFSELDVIKNEILN